MSGPDAPRPIQPSRVTAADPSATRFTRRSARGRKFARSVYSGPILRELRSAIVAGNLDPGTRLVEERLAAEFGVSRGPIRSALLALESEGLVATLPSGGMAVVGFGLEDLSSLSRVRFLLESSAVRWGVEAGADAEPISVALSALGQPGAGLREDMTFHRSIVQFGRCRFLLQAWDSVSPLLEAVVELAINVVIAEGDHEARSGIAGGDHERIYKAHAPIADAIAEGDTARACALLERQFTEAGKSLRRYFSPAPRRPSRTQPEGVSA